MPMDICQPKLDEIKACVDALQAQIISIQEGIDFNVEAEIEPCVPWFDEERRDILRQATILVYLAELDLACYPLSASAVIFVE